MSSKLSGTADYSQISFNSSDFVDGSLNRPVFSFSRAIDLYPDFFRVKWCQFPTSYYVFTSAYTSCTINGTAVTWPQGNYTPSEWLAVVNPQLTNILGTYNAVTNRLVFTHTLGTALTITFSGSQAAWELLGFNSGVNTGASPYTSPRGCLFGGPNYMYLHSTFSSVFNQEKFINTGALRSSSFNDVLTMIPITEDRNSVCLYQSSDDEYFYVPTTHTHRIDFYFTLGERTEIVDFNGLSFQVVMSGLEML